MLPEMSHRLLLVEDDDQIAAPLIRTLEREDYQVERVATGLSAVERIGAGNIDLVLLDLGLPDIDGLEVCRRVRAAAFEGGIMILTARGGELDRVVGLDIGADDYLAKPFALAELLARVRALLRRSTPAAAGAGPSAPTTETAAAAAGDVRIDTQSRRVWVGVDELGLTAKEFDVMALLASEPGTVMKRERVMDEVWDENWFGSTKTLDTTIGRLRQKLEDSGASSRIVTVRGVGFRLESDASDA
ncbi:MAG: Two-component system response regulator [Aeromicrobium sp.]|nr:Two-component system response regulator [Aeromicrobium sp.]